MVTVLDSFAGFNDFVYCGFLSTLRIKIAGIFILTMKIRLPNGEGSISRSGLLVIKSFSCFFRVVFKDSGFFNSNAIISYDFSISEKGFYCILKLFTTFFAVTFKKYAF